MITRPATGWWHATILRMMNRVSFTVTCRAASSIIIHCMISVRRKPCMARPRRNMREPFPWIRVCARRRAKWVDVPPASLAELVRREFSIKFPVSRGGTEISQWPVLYQLIVDYDFSIGVPFQFTEVLSRTHARACPTMKFNFARVEHVANPFRECPLLSACLGNSWKISVSRFVHRRGESSVKIYQIEMGKSILFLVRNSRKSRNISSSV